MSYLNQYRINFSGGFSTNVNTANNAYPPLSTTDPGMIYIDPVKSILAAPLLQMTDNQAMQFLKQLKTDQSGLNSEWNYMGDYETKLVGAKVTSAGLPGKVSDKTPLAGESVYLVGSKGRGPAVMVDLDPTGGGVATQLFSGGIQIGDAESAVSIVHDNVSYSYFLGRRFGAKSKGFKGLSVWYQFAIPKDAVPKQSGNATLSEFFERVHSGNGMVVRITLFEVTPSMSEVDLAKEFALGNAPSNPAVGYAIGTLSVWLKGEIGTSLPGRVLSNAGPNYSSALADISSSGLLSIDLVNAIPKQDYRQTPTDVSKIGPNSSVGPLKVVNGITNKEVTSFTPDPINYWKTGGIVDIQLDNETAKGLVGNPIILTDGTTGTELKWTEIPYRIESYQRGLYLDDPSQSAVVVIKITEYGQPPTQAVTIKFSTDSSSFFPDQWPDPKNITFSVNGASTDHIDLPAGTSEATLNLHTNGQPGTSQLVFTAQGRFGTGAFEACVRVFPFDDYGSTIAAGPIPWKLVYDEVLRFYYVLFPAMSLRLPLNRPEILTIPGIAAQIKARMDPALFNSTSYMPITRSMSPGKRKLLSAFLDNPAMPSAPSKLLQVTESTISWHGGQPEPQFG